MTEDQLLAALRAALAADGDSGGALTTVEIAAEMRCDEKTARKRVKRLMAAKKAECVTVRRARMDGQVQPVPAYRLIA